ncbi:hypothetical protein SAMN04488104_101264 [Algoriphagus faecimaris]|uniref:Acetyltransferase (GNAT) domain-containing protein n=1 Tax=Algoriphagus faecimaris TaxID=686796 RepID=A0A1G6RDP2_9BACT|nr:hypothetical protein [Algoriphagus faecimaris]SDD02513.1 hypothetical protein SAMN04488104_101264 [Algoriphagus faecimaris]
MRELAKKNYGEYTLSITNGGAIQADYFLANLISDGAPLLHFVLTKAGKTLADITFALTEDLNAVSLENAPFGGIWTYASLKSAKIQLFIEAILAYCKEYGIRSVKVTQAPKPYDSHADLINYLFFKSGFRQESVLAHQFFLGRKKIKKFISDNYNKTQAKLKKEGGQINSAFISDFGFLDDLKRWNQAKGYSFTLDLERLVQQVSLFPERYFLISLEKRGITLGYSVGVKLTSNSMYYFLSGMDPKAPIKNVGEYMLMELFQLAMREKTEFIDLGSSDLESHANHPLMFFKSRFSNDISNKVTWIRFL